MSSDEIKVFPQAFTKPPVQPLVKKPGQLTPDQLNHFFTEGFVILEDFLDINLLNEVKSDLESQVDQLAQKLYNAGKVKNLYKDKDFFTRTICLNNEFPGVSVIHHKSDNLAPSIKKLWSNEKLLDAVEQIVGPSIAANPVWNLRIKLPRNAPEEVPWHQDNGYFEPDACETMMCTAWIPLLDTSKTNGGLGMIRKTHQKGMLGNHYCCTNGLWYIEMDEEYIEKTFDCKLSQDEIECKVPYGGLVLFNNSIVHCSYTNLSEKIRWSLDLRWQDPAKPNGRPEGNECMPLFRKDGQQIQNIDWSVMIDRHKVSTLKRVRKCL